MKPEPMQHAKALPNATSPIVKWFDQYGNAATAIACVAMIGGAIWFSYHRTSSARSQSAWAQYSQARTAEDFANIADTYESTDVGAWARLGQAERHLESGIALMFTDRTSGLDELKEADKAFHKVLSSKAAASLTRERAQWGLAKSTETQSDADTAKAIEAYQVLLKEFPKTTYKAAAEERIEALKSDSAKAFYAWFHKQAPKPPDRKKPADGLPPGHPEIDAPSKELPTDSEKPEVGEKKDETKSDEKPTTSETDKPKEEPSDSVTNRLKTEVEADFNRIPLQDAFKLIADKCEVKISIDGDALKAAGFTKNMPQTLTLGKTTGLDAIAAILKRYESEKVPMVLVVDDAQKKALITTTEFAEKGKLTPFAFPKESDKPKDESDKSKENAEKPKGVSKDAPAESK